MTNFTQKKPWAELPIAIREILSREDTAEKIEAIGEKQGLPIMERGFLVRITANLMRGVITPVAFVETIADELSVSREKAAYLAQDINRDIFSLVKDALQEVHATPEKKEVVAPLDPSLVTCLPGEMSAAAALANKAPGNVLSVAPIVSAPIVPPVPTGSIFEQKLGGAFRMKGELSSSMGVANPTQVIPPNPQVAMPASRPQPDAATTTTRAFDQYRELPH